MNKTSILDDTGPITGGTVKTSATAPSVFGSPERDAILVLLRLRNETHLRELSRIFSSPASNLSRVVRQLELDGLVVATTAGRTRLLRLNPRFYARREIEALLEAMALARPDLYQPGEGTRSRPRRSGKLLA
jgi:DNA-binding MarR family transcriptional regulator